MLERLPLPLRSLAWPMSCFCVVTGESGGSRSIPSFFFALLDGKSLQSFVKRGTDGKLSAVWKRQRPSCSKLFVFPFPPLSQLLPDAPSLLWFSYSYSYSYSYSSSVVWTFLCLPRGWTSCEGPSFTFGIISSSSFFFFQKDEIQSLHALTFFFYFLFFVLKRLSQIKKKKLFYLREKQMLKSVFQFLNMLINIKFLSLSCDLLCLFFLEKRGLV